MKIGIDKWKLVIAINLDLKQINSSNYGTSTLMHVVIEATRLKDMVVS